MPATEPRLTKERQGTIFNYPLAAATTIYQGTQVALNAAGNAVPGSDTAALRIVGIAEETVINAGAAGAETINVKRGVFLLDNSGTAAVDADDKGKVCYVEDDQTVAETSTNKIPAGRVMDVTTEGVWVDNTFASIAPTVVTLTSTDGTAAAASASLANLAAEAEKIGDDVRAIHAVLVASGLIK